MENETVPGLLPDGNFGPVHPGEILEEEFLKPLDISRYQLAKVTGLSETQIREIIRGERGITAATALRLSAYFGNTAKFWTNLQSDYDLRVEMVRLSTELSAITPRPRELATA